MCDSHNCEHPERLKTKPGECSAEQVFLCHGIVEDESQTNKDK